MKLGGGRRQRSNLLVHTKIKKYILVIVPKRDPKCVHYTHVSSTMSVPCTKVDFVRLKVKTSIRASLRLHIKNLKSESE